MKTQNFYQFCMIACAVLVILGVGFFLYKELFPEYKVYQNTYKALETFRSTYTGETPAPFDKGIKQIMVSNDSNGPEIIDRCISCHVTLDLNHFSKTRVARDINDNLSLNEFGNPVLEENPDYIWKKLDEKIEKLTHSETLQHLKEEGKEKEIKSRHKQAKKLSNLKTVMIDGKKVDMTKALLQHPLIGAETRPFEFHPKDKYGCTSCHSGNGRSIEAERAHGPLYDEDYEPAFHEKKPEFTEIDEKNDPKFAKMYNHKPGHALVFQTNPLLAGPLISARCAECHLSGSQEISSTMDKFAYFTGKKEEELRLVKKGIENDKKALISLLTLQNLIQSKGREGTLQWLNEKLSDFHLPLSQIDTYEGWVSYLNQNEEIEVSIRRDVTRLLGSEEEAENWMKMKNPIQNVDSYYEKKISNEDFEKDLKIVRAFERANQPEAILSQDKKLMEKMRTDVDRLILSYSRGKELFITQGCYGCHRIAGFSRAAIGPDLTKAGLSYPWYLKESIVWPQADLPSSTMPNFLLDHDEVGDLMAFLMAQKGNSKAISEMDNQIKLNEWDAGKKMPWEEPLLATDIYNVKKGMLTFAKEGCAACHRLQGYKSNIQFVHEKHKSWFLKLFPEHIQGSILAKIVKEKADEIDSHLVESHEPLSILEEIDKDTPDLLMSFYSNFKFAFRAQNADLKNEPEKLADYKKRLKRVFMMYIQEHGLGRDIAPHLNWSGVYRDNAWLMGHFHNPSAYTARSLMPSMPFDDSKFYMLSYMLHVLGKKNRDQLKDAWKKEGFSPARAYEALCSQCHGEFRQGTGIVAEWIYPIPKNLKNPIFLNGLTKERAIDSITHGIKGTPMPPWGTAAPEAELGDQEPVLSKGEIQELVNWLYQGLPPEPRQAKSEEFEKWHYNALDVIKEMQKEGKFLEPAPKKGLSQKELVLAYFDASPCLTPGPDAEHYTIKEKYYTSENLAQAQKFFLVNCAPCHGKEGTGTGLRAASMVEAKPRILTNIPWIKTRDDLRLLRSIKYGVAGTAMIPWGDQTSSEQRMQLVMYIRKLSKAGILRDRLEELLYDLFDEKVQKIDLARKEGCKNLEVLERKLQEVEEKLVNAFDSDVSLQTIGNLYIEKTRLFKEKEKALKEDGRYKEWVDLIYQEKKINTAVGAQILSLDLSSQFVESFFSLIQSNPLEYSIEKQELNLEVSQEKEKSVELIMENLLQELSLKSESLQTRIEEQEKHRGSQEKLSQLREEQGTYINLKSKIAQSCAETKNLREAQVKIYESIH